MGLWDSALSLSLKVKAFKKPACLSRRVILSLSLSTVTHHIYKQNEPRRTTEETKSLPERAAWLRFEKVKFKGSSVKSHIGGGETCEESPTAIPHHHHLWAPPPVQPLLLNDITVPLPHIPLPDIETSGESALCWGRGKKKHLGEKKNKKYLPELQNAEKRGR